MLSKSSFVLDGNQKLSKKKAFQTAKLQSPLNSNQSADTISPSYNETKSFTFIPPRSSIIPSSTKETYLTNRRSLGLDQPKTLLTPAQISGSSLVVIPPRLFSTYTRKPCLNTVN